jgi:predicted ATPase/DNA-binding winged helix-turn-helix (wHTH) protein
VGICFGSFEVDEQLFELRQSGVPVRVDRKVFDLLCYLVEHRDRVVDKQELLDRVWAGDTVVEAVIPTAVARLRKALGQSREANEPIQTVHGRGYRFNGEVTATPARRISDAAVAKGPSNQPQRRAGAPLDTDMHRAVRDPFVGREALMERLLATLDAVLEGNLRGRLLVGQPGIGKTRVCTELASIARKRGLRVWTGRCPPIDQPIAFWPWQQVVRHGASARELQAVRSLSAPQRDAMSALMPDLLGSHDPTQSAPPTQAAASAPLSSQAQLALRDAVCAWLRASTAQGPLMIVLDDLHWADAPSLELLEHVLAELGDVPLLIVGTYRDAELEKGHPHAALIDRIDRAACWKRIAVGTLEAGDVAQYLLDLTGEAVPDQLAARIHERTGGNPFLVRETVRSLSTRDFARERKTYSDIEVPSPARDVIRRRASVLPESTQRFLEAASVHGMEIDLAIIASMRGKASAAELLDDLDRAMAAQLVEPQGASRTGNAFVHPVIRDTLYGDLSSRTRRDLHLAAARALEQRNDPREASAIAEHRTRAGESGALGSADAD